MVAIWPSTSASVMRITRSITRCTRGVSPTKPTGSPTENGRITVREESGRIDAGRWVTRSVKARAPVARRIGCAGTAGRRRTALDAEPRPPFPLRLAEERSGTGRG